jgi:hypothetical protein
MNIQNIASLSEMLASIGFDLGIGHRLLQYICFKPSDFILTEQLQRGKDTLTCSILFERKGDEYTCNYYDASLLKEMEMPDLVVNSVNLRELDHSMAEINWQLDNKSANGFTLNNEATWQREKRIEKVVVDISRLSVTEEGKHFADCLKLKYWSGLNSCSMFGNLNAIKSRFEVSQRFYFFDGQGISIEEAYRFLLNRWLEKRMNSRKKLEASESDDLADENMGSGNDKNLLQKKRKSKTNKIKR